MFNFSKLKSIITVVVVLVAILVTASNFKASSSNKIKLGLDLQGGSYLVLQANINQFTNSVYASTAQNIAQEFTSNSIAFNGYSIANNTVVFALQPNQPYNTIVQIVNTIDKNLDVSVNNNNLNVVVSQNYVAKQLNSVMQNSVEIIRKRIDELGTNEPSIKIQGGNNIVVELPGVDNPERIKNLIGTTAQMNFHMVDAETTFSGGRLKPGYRFLPSAEGDIKYAVKMDPVVYGTDLVNAKLEFQNQQPVVGFTFNTNGAKRFAKVTTQNQGQLMAIVLDNTVLSAPRISTAITNGSGIITGNFTPVQAQDLALLLRAGSLPTPLSIVEERTVGPTLGADSIKTGIYATIVGYILVFLFMAIFYKKLGIVGNVALLVNTILILACLTLLNATLTLPGIAGIILTIGMAIDANILVYERFAAEVKNHTNGQSIALNKAFNRVFTTILDSNITTLFTALFLFSFGSGPIKGLAVTLIVGILCSMFSIMFITKFVIKHFALKRNTII